MRRALLLMLRLRSCGSLALLLWFMFVVPTPTYADDSWVGKTVLVKKTNIRIGHTDDNDREVFVATLQYLAYKVLADKGGFIRVREYGIEGWFNKKDAVLLEDAVDFFTDRIRHNPKGAGAFNDRGVAWRLRGEVDIAIKDYDDSIRLNPKHFGTFVNRGGAWQLKKEYEKAIKDYEEAIRLDPKDAHPYFYRGHVWLARKEYDKAIKDYDEAIRLNPRFVKAFNYRGKAWQATKEFDKAIKDYNEAIRLDPQDPVAYNSRGTAMNALKEYDKAINDYEEAIRLDQNNTSLDDFDPNSGSYLSDLAWLRSTCPNNEYRDGKQAVRLAEMACKLTGWKNPSYLNTLAASYAAAGDFQQAIKHQNNALKNTDYEKDFGEAARLRLALYEKSKPYYEYSSEILDLLGPPPATLRFPRAVPATIDP
jgi:tetratricopeptide (TPR) repeat protein